MLVLVLEASDRINYVLFGGAYSRMTVSVVHARMVCDIVVIFSRSPEPGVFSQVNPPFTIPTPCVKWERGEAEIVCSVAITFPARGGFETSTSTIFSASCVD